MNKGMKGKLEQIDLQISNDFNIWPLQSSSPISVH